MEGWGGLSGKVASRELDHSIQGRQQEPNQGRWELARVGLRPLPERPAQCPGKSKVLVECGGPCWS